MRKVSVILPTHNRADLLQSAVHSVLNQTFRDFELIIIDDHSTDHTTNVIKRFNDKRINYLQNTGKNGPSIARNFGMKNATGKYIAFLDDDDEWFPDKLEKQIKILDLAKPDVCGIYSRPLIIERKTGNVILNETKVKKLRGSLLSQLMIKNPIQTSTLIIRKVCIDKIGMFDENMRYMEDRDLFIRLAMNWDFEYIDEPLTKKFHHGYEHLSENLSGQTIGREVILRRYSDLLKTKKRSWSLMHICLGAQYCQMGKMKKGRKNLLKGIVIYPFNKISFFHLFASFWGKNNYQRIRHTYKSSAIE